MSGRPSSPRPAGGNARLRLAAVLAAALIAAGLAAASPFGINVHLGPPKALDRITGDGVVWVRVDFVWALVETAPGELDWSLYDQVVERIEQRGFRIYATLAGTPEWATDGAPLSGPPRDPERWAEFCYRAAARYRGRIDAWGFWNEPNLPRFWQGGRNRYLDEILRPGLAAVAAADPTALRVGPDLAHLESADWDDWLEAVLIAASDELDVVAHHVYPSGASAGSVIDKLDRDPDWPWEDDPVRRVLQRRGWWGRPFWLTETGLQSASTSGGIQSLFYRSLVDRLFRPEFGLGWVDRVFFYELADSGDPSLSWGILGPPPEYPPKEAAAAYRNTIAVSVVDDAEVVASDRQLVAPPQADVTARIVLRNTGTTSWSAADGHHLAPLRAPLGWRVAEVPLPANRRVRPSATVEVSVPVSTGIDRGIVAPGIVLYRMVRPDGTPFGDPIRIDVWLSDGPPPELVRQPGTVVAAAGGSAEFSVGLADPDLRVSYQWFRNGIALADTDTTLGSRTATLTLYDVGPGDAGEYRCAVTARVRVMSDPGRLEVLDGSRANPAPRRYGGRHGPDPKVLESWMALRDRPVR